MPQKFWMVQRAESVNKANAKFCTLGEAITEANRMAATMPGTYFVLESVGCITAKIENMDIEMRGYDEVE